MINVIDTIAYLVARLRWKLYRVFLRLTLGPVGGYGPHRNMVYSISSSIDDDVRAHVLEDVELEPAHIESLGLGGGLPVAYPAEQLVPARHLYRLKDVAISTSSGAVWVPKKFAFLESLGTLLCFYSWGGFVDVMQPPRRMMCEGPVVASSNVNYFHCVLDSTAQLLLAREKVPNLRVAVAKDAHRYVRESLAFFGFETARQIPCGRPIRVDETILVSRNPELGLIPRENLRVLRQELARRLRPRASCSRRIYVSRRLEKNRAIENEEAVEHLVRKFGFEVCYFEKMPFAEQMQTAAEASVLMGVHGAGLTNMIAGSPGLKVFEILNPDWYVLCFVNLARQLGFEYHHAVLTRTPRGGLAVDLAALEKSLVSLDRT